MRTRILISLLSLVGVLGCGTDYSSSSLSSIQSSFPEVIFNSPPTVAGAPIGNGGALPTYSTSSGGIITLKQRATLPLLSGQSVRALSRDSGNLYFLVRKDLGSNVIRWDIWQLLDSGGGTIQLCSFLDDSHFSGGLALDGTYFYTFYIASGTIQKLRRFARSNCTEATALDLGTTIPLSYYSNYGSLSLDSGIFYLVQSGNSNAKQFKLSTQLATQWTLSSTKLGTETHSFDGVDWVSNGIGWSKTNGNLWKIQAQGGVIGWAQLPYRDFPDLLDSSVDFIVAKGTQEVILGSTASSTALKLYYFLVGGF